MAKQLPQIETASTNLTKVVTAVDQAVIQLKAVATEAENLQTTIEEKQAAIKTLDVDFAEKLRAATVDLNLQVKENYKSVVQQYLLDNKLTMLPTDELDSLKTAVETNTIASKQEKDAALAEQDKALLSQFTAKIGVIKAEQAATLAEANANVVSLTDKVLFLQTQVRQLLEQLESERQAGVERARAAQNVYNTYSAPETSRK